MNKDKSFESQRLHKIIDAQKQEIFCLEKEVEGFEALERQHGEVDEHLIDNMRMMIVRLARRLPEENEYRKEALRFLQRKVLQGSPLRKALTQTPEKPDAS